MSNYRFGGHEGFPPRSLWPVKGIAAISEDEMAFTRADAVVRFGVGKNMVSSIRFWLLQMGLANQAEPKGSIRPTKFGRSILDPGEGSDPFLESHETYWILHWKMCSNLLPSSIFHLTFGKFQQMTFTRESLLSWVESQVHGSGTGARVSPNTIKRDIDILVRAYSQNLQPRSNRQSEDLLDSPFSDLGLLTEVEPGLFQFQRRDAIAISARAFGFLMVEYWLATFANESVLSFDALMYGEGSPARIFRLSTESFSELMDEVSNDEGLIRTDETAGLRTLILDREEAISESSATWGRVNG